MIVIDERSLRQAATIPPNPPYPDPLPLTARNAGQAASAVLMGELDAEEASTRYGVALPTLMAWLRALLAAGLDRRIPRQVESRSWPAASGSPRR